MLDVLLESAAHTPRPNRATMFSVIIHSALIVVFAVGREAPRLDAESDAMENVRYLIPFDRVKAPPPLEVRTHWYGTGAVGEGTGLDARPRKSDAATGPPESGRKS